MRTPYQRDRDRIIHATAFRRLTYKTQVFVFHEGDHYRTRLTHSLEVAQIARAIARMLALDEDLAEALALAHDLGHPPFGHAGERALAEVMAPYGGFDHNAQSFKVVTRLERKYAGFDGLNLTLETLEGLAKHNGPLLGTNASGREAAARGHRTGGPRRSGCISMQFAPAEAQAAAIADDIAYNSHDLDDGLRAGLIDLGDLADVPLAGRFVRGAPRRRGRAARHLRGQPPHHHRHDRRRGAGVARCGWRRCRGRAWRACARRAAPSSPRRRARRAEIEGLQRYLFANVYRHPRVMRVVDGAETIVRDLFGRYLAEPGEMPRVLARRRRGGRGRGRARRRGGRFRRRHDRPLRHQGAPAAV